MSTVSISTPGGTFHGHSTGAVNYFHSIPYSTIPGAFSQPKLRENAGDVDATVPRPQEVALSVTAPGKDCAVGGSPVVVYIHGGRYETGTHEDPRADGTSAARNGTVVVQLGYRVGLAGFARLEEDDYFFYRGINDCQVGLEWVQNNIEAFGGDPTNVTLVGQSAGATTALWLSRRDHYRGAFRRVLALSPCFPRQGFEHRKATLRSALKTPLTQANLEKLTPAQLDAGYAAFRKKYKYDMALGPYPLIPQDLAEIPIVVTSTREEFFDLGAKADKTAARTAIAWWLAPTFGLRRERFSTWLDLSRAKDNPTGKLIGDSTIRQWVEQVGSAAPGQVWVMEFTRSNGPALHCQELQPLFGVTDSPLHTWLLDFARTGNTGWQPYQMEQAVACADLNSGDMRTTYGSLNYVAQAFGQY